MATNSSIPKKYLPALVYYASMFMAEWQERSTAKDYFEREGDKRLLKAYNVDDGQYNGKNTDSVGTL